MILWFHSSWGQLPKQGEFLCSGEQGVGKCPQPQFPMSPALNHPVYSPSGLSCTHGNLKARGLPIDGLSPSQTGERTGCQITGSTKGKGGPGSSPLMFCGWRAHPCSSPAKVLELMYTPAPRLFFYRYEFQRQKFIVEMNACPWP